MTNRMTDGRNDRRTDRPSYRDAWTHLKRELTKQDESINNWRDREVREEGGRWGNVKDNTRGRRTDLRQNGMQRMRKTDRMRKTCRMPILEKVSED